MALEFRSPRQSFTQAIAAVHISGVDTFASLWMGIERIGGPRETELDHLALRLTTIPPRICSRVCWRIEPGSRLGRHDVIGTSLKKKNKLLNSGVARLELLFSRN